jgi:hypothetical protein
MTVSLFHRLQVKDFDSWLNPDQDAVTQMMREQGVLALSLSRNLDDRNSLNIHYQFADENAAKLFVTWMEAAMAHWASEDPDAWTQKTVEWWMGEDIRPYWHTAA